MKNSIKYSNQCINHAVKNAADGKYKKLIAESTKHIVSIMI